MILHRNVVFATACATIGLAWNPWDYKVTWDRNGIDSKEAATNIKTWGDVWNKTGSLYDGDRGPPRPRRGHSLHIIKTDPNSAYEGDTYLVLFGGRDNDQADVHIPKTYDVESKDGTLVFTTYDQRPVSACNDFDNKYYTEDERKGCTNSSYLINVGLTYNDVWAYKLCNQSAGERDFDHACADTGWELWHSGARQGGCLIQLGIEVCTVPSERYNHASVLFDDGTLYVYGGFSERCADFCDDIWFFDIYLKSWRQIYTEGQLTQFYSDYYFEVLVMNDPKDVPVDNTAKKYAGPSKRWRHSMVMSKPFVDAADDNLVKQNFALYGGHRLWHGYSPENSEDNNWDSYITRPKGGYLDDLWIYTKVLDLTTDPGSAFKSSNGKWKKMEPATQCFSTPGVTWDSRFDISCRNTTPPGRASHGSAYDDAADRIWIFGGYNTYYPYLSTDGIGSGDGVTSVGSGGFVPYPGYEYFKNDLWYYNLTSSIWTQVEYPDDSPVPAPRMDMVFLLLGDIIFMHGGFADNFVFSDTWYFNITTSRWLQRETFVNPIYATNCTDDLKYIREHNCTRMTWPKHLDREQYYPFDVLPYSQQEYYWPDTQHGPYYGIFPKEWDTSDEFKAHTLKSGEYPQPGTAEFPFAATGVMQYAKNFTYSFNNSHNATLVESCTSVFGEPTRGRVTDGLYGRANGSIFIAQPRPQKPGWDGCRDRYDNRTDLTAGLQYVQPNPLYSHRAIFSADTNEIIMYGGLAYATEQPAVLNNSWAINTTSSMWYYNLHHCVNNCSSNGDCFYGFCHCFSGFYGVDCSNTSCPGTFCYYDDISHEQICTHACQAGYRHTDADIYVQDIAKLPCSLEDMGESNGICDGFGTTQCAPPFVGDDCGTKDCKNNCSFNGWCSIEYPVSRCMCTPGYFGEICEQRLCLNNCSYPNGICNSTSGVCACNMMYSPYNNTREFKPWGGEDCSYLFPYAGGVRTVTGVLTLLWYWVVLAALIAVVNCSSSNSGGIKQKDLSFGGAGGAGGGGDGGDGLELLQQYQPQPVENDIVLIQDTDQ